MTTQTMRDGFEKDHPKPSDAIFREDWNAYVWSEYPNTHHKYNDVWLAYQSGCAASAERIQELERQVAEKELAIDFLRSGTVEKMHDLVMADKPFPLFSTEQGERMQGEIDQLRSRLVSVTDEYLNAEATCAELKRKLEEKCVVELPAYHYILGCPCVLVDEVAAAIEASGATVKEKG